MTSQSSEVPKLKIPAGTLPGVRKALRHWHEHRPKMYTDLHNSGTLMEVATAAHEAAVADSGELQASLEKEYNTYTAAVLAKRIADQRYIYLPTEEDVPNLMETADGVPIYQSD